jgi:hypothetical protein
MQHDPTSTGFFLPVAGGSPFCQGPVNARNDVTISIQVQRYTWGGGDGGEGGRFVFGKAVTCVLVC